MPFASLPSFRVLGPSTLDEVALDPPGSYVVPDLSGQSVVEISDTSEWAGFTAFIKCPTAPSGTAPTLDARIEHAPDDTGTMWVTLASFAQFTAVGVKSVSIPGPGTSDAKTFGQFIRIVLKLGGTDEPTWTNVEVWISPKVRA